MDIFVRLVNKCTKVYHESLILQYFAPLDKMSISLNDDDVLNTIHLYVYEAHDNQIKGRE